MSELDIVRNNEESSTERRARLLGLRYLDVRTLQTRPVFESVIGIDELKTRRIVPITFDDRSGTFGITTNTSPKIKDEFRDRFSDRRLEFVLISDSAFNEYVLLYDPPPKVEYKDISLGSENDASLDQISQSLQSVRADDMLAYIVQQAYKLSASDIHIETAEDHALVRFRVHGVLHPVAKLMPDRYRMFIAALASAANVSTSAREAQTGHVGRRYVMEDGSEVIVNLRVETVQAINGMDVVMRLFNFRPEMLHLENLGLSDYQRQIIGDIVSHPSGLVLIVGPTGSGKSTTLYSIINELKSPTRKIITLEDPVEYQMQGITQIPVISDAGASFNEGLRAVMRLDPDVIMVGEIRDQDTARTALQASITGHLVLSTYHAGRASEAMTRMLDAMDDNPLFISAIRLIQAQRLVRMLDDQTKIAYQPDEALANKIRQIVNSLPEGVTRPDTTTITLYKPGSSPQNPFGFSDQIAIRELMLITPELQHLLQDRSKIVTSQDIEKVATESGHMLTLLQDGVLKALAGKTTIEEVYRVVD